MGNFCLDVGLNGEVKRYTIGEVATTVFRNVPTKEQAKAKVMGAPKQDIEMAQAGDNLPGQVG